MIDNSKYYRPMQYLGSKTRALDTIITECQRLYKPGEFIVDLFSGSSIVSQSFYNSGMNTISNDVLSFCCDISSCMLNVGRKVSSTQLIEDLLHQYEIFTLKEDTITPFFSYIAKESELLKGTNIRKLQSLYKSFPQVGKTCKSHNPQISFIENHIGEKANEEALLIANYYAGTYFGIKQAVELDTTRIFIEKVFSENHDKWVNKVLLTALYNVCSIIVHSAGKHFAQPVLITDYDVNKITNKRLFENRKFDVREVFVDCVTNIIKSLSIFDNRIITDATNVDVCSDKFNNIFSEKDISVFYADPPYTAQQYSRFYHIPEVIHSYRYPKLQIFRGGVTQGLYPEGKYKSPFCSKTSAKAGFMAIFNLVNSKKSNLILSYSESKKKETGNERMVTMNDIIQMSGDILKDYKMTQIDFDFEYKQLNKKQKVVDSKEDKEFLIVFER